MMNSNKREFKVNFGGKEVTVETGRMAKQADGSVLVTSGGTQVLVTVVSAHKAKEGQDFFPLTVDYTEKFYSAGKFLGGFMKREGRPSVQETLNSRLIDRPLRPLFPEGYLFDTFVQATVLSYSKEGDPEIMASLGASAALSISDIPFAGPIGSCKVGRINGELCLNPSYDEWENSDLELVVSASKDAILMVEGEGDLVNEADMLAAIKFAHENIKDFCACVDQMISEVGKTKRHFEPVVPKSKLLEKVSSDFSGTAREALNIVDKLDRQKAVRALEVTVASAIKADASSFGLTEEDSASKEAAAVVDELMYNMMRADILDEEKRIGGRKLDEVRDIETEAGILSGPHGSSLFTRGETQVLATATLGGSGGDQMSDRITGLSYQKFYLHYNFPPFSVGEARGVRGVGRREQGHGNLAERAIKAVMPSHEDFSYTARVVCEVLESNGSSSMGSVCSGSMALMEAGVPLKAPVAGIAMGLIKDETRYKILTDILGDEDHLGDMDFKVAGTTEGITAIQMDIKIAGLSGDIIEEALEQARKGRLHILEEMAKTISTHRTEFKKGVPRIESFKIKPDTIGALIGPGGKNIKALQENFEVNMEVKEDGTVMVEGIDPEKIQATIETAQLQINGPGIGSVYQAKVVTVKEYGAFVEIGTGISGLVHVSEFSDERVRDVNEYVSEGDVISVKVIDQDRMGRIKLSAKAVTALTRKSEA